MTFALDDLAENGCAYVFDLSAAPHVALALLMQGWRRLFIQTAHRHRTGADKKIEHKLPWIASGYQWISGYLGKLPILVSPFSRLRSHSRRLSLRISGKPCSPFADLDPIEGRDEINPHVSLSKNPRPQAMAELTERIGTDGRIRHVRDEQYFEWRFQNPLSEYRFLYWDDNRLDGYLALHAKLDTQSYDVWAYILDWEATSEQVWTDLIQTITRRAKFKELCIWSETLSNDVKRLLREAGFTFYDRSGGIHHDVRGENVLLRSLGQEMRQPNWVLAGRNLLNRADWDLRMIYSDNY
jgi:hypothetical protein